MKIELEFSSMKELKLQLKDLLDMLESTQVITQQPVPLPTIPTPSASVEQDLAKVPVTSTPSREDLKPKRTRRTKAELEAEKKASDLADGPANSRPITINDSLMVTEGVVKEPVAEVPKSNTPSEQSLLSPPTAVSSGDVAGSEEQRLQNFKENFTKIIFMMMQNKTIDSAYIEAKQKYYNVASILSMKDDDARLEHFYQALRTEGKV